MLIFRVILGDSSSCIHMMFFGKLAIAAARRMIEGAFYRIQHFRLSDKQGGAFSIGYISFDLTKFGCGGFGFDKVKPGLSQSLINIIKNIK